MKIRLCCKVYFSSSQVYHFWKRTKLKPKEVIRQSLEILAVLRTAKRATKPKIILKIMSALFIITTVEILFLSFNGLSVVSFFYFTFHTYIPSATCDFFTK